MTQFNEEYSQKYGFGGWDDVRPQSKCLMCKGTGHASGDPTDPNACGFCTPDQNMCIFPDCAEEATRNIYGSPDTERPLWCHNHFGLFPHTCEEYGCDHRVAYDDEPRCFTHSPDSGSSVRGYSAYKKSISSAPPADPNYTPF